MARVSIKKGAARLRDVITLVERGEEVELTRRGTVVAVIVPVPRRGERGEGPGAADAAAGMQQRLHALRTSPPGRGRGLSTKRAEALVERLHPSAKR